MFSFFFHSIHQTEDTIHKTLKLPLRVTFFCRVFTIYDFGAARDADVSHNISFAPNMAITHRVKGVITQQKDVVSRNLRGNTANKGVVSLNKRYNNAN